MIRTSAGSRAAPAPRTSPRPAMASPAPAREPRINGNLAKAIAPNLTVASYWAQPWGHVDFAGVLVPMEFNDGHFISREYLGYGGHFSGDVKPGWFGWAKDDFLFSFIAGEGIGYYTSGGWTNASAMATNFTVATACATPHAGLHGRDGGVERHFLADLCVEREWRLPALVDAEPALDVSGRHRPPRPQLAADRAEPRPARLPRSSGTPLSIWCGTRSRSSPPVSSTIMAPASSSPTARATRRVSPPSSASPSRRRAMLELIEGLPGNVVGIAVSGRLTMQDCQDVLVPAIRSPSNGMTRLGSITSSTRGFPALHGTSSNSGWRMLRAANGLRS